MVNEGIGLSTRNRAIEEIELAITKRSMRQGVAVVAVVLGIGAVAAITTALASRGKTERATGSTTDAPNTTLRFDENGDPVPLPPPPLHDEERPVVEAAFTGTGMVAADLGCVDDLTSVSIDRLLRERLGPSLGIDNPHVYELGENRYVWLFHDAFLHYNTDVETIPESHYLQNVAVLQEGLCFHMLHKGTVAAPRPFENGRRPVPGRFFWPLGAGLGQDEMLYVFWSEMQEDQRDSRINGIKRHPVGTWIGVYDPATLKRVAFAPAPNRDAMPQYGSVVETLGRYSYLFGNSNQLNLELEGGIDAGPFSGTREYLARVPAGEFSEPPEYFAGGSWSSDPTDATPISERYDKSNAMQPRIIDGRWYSVVKVDEFWGHNLVIDVAEHPWGPWETIYDEELPIRAPEGADPSNFVTYQPILLPWLDRGRLIVVVSQNAWLEAQNDPRQYRPRVMPIPVE